MSPHLQLEALDLLLQGPLAVLQLLQLAVLVPLAEPQRQELFLQGEAFGSAVPEPLLESTGGMSTWNSSGEKQHHTRSRQQLEYTKVSKLPPFWLPGMTLKMFLYSPAADDCSPSEKPALFHILLLENP